MSAPGDAAFAGALAGFAPLLEWREGGEGDGDASLHPHLLRFHASTGGPWAAACSLWGQIYFNTLLIPATCRLARGWPADAHVRQLCAAFSPDNGAPLRFTLCGEFRGHREPSEAMSTGLAANPPSAEAALVRLIESHVARVIDELAALGGLSRRMLWEGAERAIRWTVAEIAASHPDRLPQLARLAEASPCRLAAVYAAPCGAARPRKFCCLRYQLSGQTACPGVCPRV